MTLTVPPFRPGDTLPSVDEVANLLASAIPEADRKTARKLLIERILPIKLAGLRSHQRPQRLMSVVYKDLARTLSGRPPNMRLHVLQAAALEAEIIGIGREAQNLAIARYLTVHPETVDSDRIDPWLKLEVDKLRTGPPEILATRVQAALTQLDGWQQRAKAEYPVECERHRDKFVHIHQTLTAARSGRFDGVTGGTFQEFLRDALGPERWP